MRISHVFVCILVISGMGWGAWGGQRVNATGMQPYSASSQPPSQNSGANMVQLYELANYGGALLWEQGLGFSNEPNAVGYSLSMPTGWSVRTWRDDNRAGESRCWSASVPNLQDHGWHLSIQSLEAFDVNVCEAPPPTDATRLCTDDAATVGCQIFEVGVYDLASTAQNDTFRSLKSVKAGQSIVIYREANFHGAAECYSGARVPLPSGGDWDLAGQVTSFQVFSQPNCPLAELQGRGKRSDGHADPVGGLMLGCKIWTYCRVPPNMIILPPVCAFRLANRSSCIPTATVRGNAVAA
ncbi:MAG: hypothetical protein R2911_38965 [Caldilineaceae bacterium]